MAHLPSASGLTKFEYAELLISKGQAKQKLAEKYRQEGKFNLYTPYGQKLNNEGAWLIQQGLALKKLLGG